MAGIWSISVSLLIASNWSLVWFLMPSEFVGEIALDPSTARRFLRCYLGASKFCVTLSVMLSIVMARG